MKNEHIVTAELERMGSNLKHNVYGFDNAITTYNSILRILQGGQFNNLVPNPKSYYVRGRKLKELKPLVK